MDITAIAHLSAVTLGVFTASMVEPLGCSQRQLRRLVARGDAVQVCGAGFALVTTPVDVEQQAVSACLTWPDAIVCFRTAAALHGLPVDSDGATYVLVPNGRRATRRLVPRHWSIRPTQLEHRGPIRLTDLVTTVADCLGRLPEGEAWGLLAWVVTRDLIAVEDLEEQLRDRYHLYGAARLRAMIAAVHDGALSVGEVRFHEFLRDTGLQDWLGDQKVGARGRVIARVDVLMPDLGVVFEFDGLVAHNESTRDRDAARDVLLQRLGLIVEHVTWADMYERRGATRRRLRDAVAIAVGQAAEGTRPTPFLLRGEDRIWECPDQR